MTKEEIYAKLEYNGKYDTKVKTELRKLIKENNENDEIYPLLLEIQSELESGKAKLAYNSAKKKIEDKEESIKETVSLPKEKKKYVKKEKEIKNDSKKKKKKKKSSNTNIIGKIFIIILVLLMVFSSLSTIFTYLG